MEYTIDEEEIIFYVLFYLKNTGISDILFVYTIINLEGIFNVKANKNK